MKRYARVKNGKFIRFYAENDPELNLESDEFLDIGEDKIEQLLQEQDTTGGEIRILKTGELGIYLRKDYDISNNFVKPTFDYEKEIWYDKATLQEKVDYWYSEIKRFSKEIAIATIDNMIDPSPLVSKLETAKNIHMNLSHELGLKIKEKIK